MTDFDSLMHDRVDGSYTKTFVKNDPHSGGWVEGELGVCVREGITGYSGRRILITARENKMAEIAFTPEQATAIAIAIMRKVAELREKEGDAS